MENNFVQVQKAQNQSKPELSLPGPRIWTPRELAVFLRVSVSWVHKRTKKNASDPPPRCLGLAKLRFDTGSPTFQDWVRRQIRAVVDIEDSGHV